MSLLSLIEWTNATWNCIRGCVQCSPGCARCYAKAWAERFRGVRGHPYEFGFDFRLVPEKLVEPLRWARPRKIFVNSMSDVFLEAVPEEYIALMCSIMLASPWHTYQVLTKRSERMMRLLQTTLRDAAEAEHIWWGVSVENKKHGVPRIRDLVASPASVRFLSIEPLLEDVGTLDLGGIHWVIVGGESGAGARPMERGWAESIHLQCDAAGVPFFFKQWGGVRKNRTGRELNGRTYNAMPVCSTVPIPSLAARRKLIDHFESLRMAGGWG